jgi:8-oxo-dGTP diphosphatase
VGHQVGDDCSITTKLLEALGKSSSLSLAAGERPPGGVLELCEAIHDGLRREVREETGLDVEPVVLTGVYKNMTRRIIAMVFRCEITGGSLTTTDETADFRWATPDVIADMAAEAYAIRVIDAMREQHAPALREHDGKRLV